MKTHFHILLLLLIALIGCKETKQDPATETAAGEPIEIHEKAEAGVASTDTTTTRSLTGTETSAVDHANIQATGGTSPQFLMESQQNQRRRVYQKITDLEEYKDFTQVSSQLLEETDKVLTLLQKGSIQVLALEQVIKTNSGKPNYTLLREVRISADKTVIFSEPVACEYARRPDIKFIFGIAKKQDKKYFDPDHIIKVWEVDVEKNTFRELEPRAVKCLNHWYGYEG